jgi:putative endonuclease
MRTVDTGKSGEDRAVCFLENNGYAIVARNVRSRMGEIDIVARERGVICFIEVRSRKGAGKSEESFASVDGRKQRKLSRLALAYLKANHLLDCRARFDVVAVSLGETGEVCALVKNAFPLAERYA